MKKNIFLIFLLLLPFFAHSQVTHQDSIIHFNGAKLNYNIFRSGKAKIYIRTDGEASFSKKLSDKFYSWEIHPGINIFISASPHKLDYLTPSEFKEFGEKDIKESKTEDKGFYSMNTIRGINVMTVNCTMTKEIDSFIHQIRNYYNLKNQVFMITIQLNSDSQTGMEELIEAINQINESLLKDNIFVYDDFYK